tara:strand:+ start:941 stop:1363 length:423 start_codon:yes stop_codon:yes gene_type:complete
MILNFFKKDKNKEKDDTSVVSLTSLLIHAAKIDENYSEKEKKIIKETLLKLGVNSSEINEIIEKAEVAEKDSNQILEYTKEAKNLAHKKKILLLEALWSIIYSDENVDMYEANLMRRLSGLLYLDKTFVANIKEKIKNKV